MGTHRFAPALKSYWTRTSRGQSGCGCGWRVPERKREQRYCRIGNWETESIITSYFQDVANHLGFQIDPARKHDLREDYTAPSMRPWIPLRFRQMRTSTDHHEQKTPGQFPVPTEDAGGEDCVQGRVE